MTREKDGEQRYTKILDFAMHMYYGGSGVIENGWMVYHLLAKSTKVRPPNRSELLNFQGLKKVKMKK